MKPLLASLAASSSENPVTAKVLSTCGNVFIERFDLLDDRLGARDGGAVRQLDRHEEGALVLLGQEAGRRLGSTGPKMPAPNSDDDRDRRQRSTATSLVTTQAKPSRVLSMPRMMMPMIPRRGTAVLQENRRRARATASGR